MVSSNSNVLFGACALILLGLRLTVYQANAKKVVVVDAESSILEKELRDHIIEHPRKHTHFSTWQHKRTPDSSHVPPINLRMLLNGIHNPPSRPSQRTSDNTPPPPRKSSVILKREYKENFGMLPKERLPLSRLSQKTSDYPPPPPRASSIILTKEFSVNFGMLPKSSHIRPSGPSQKTSEYPPPPLHVPSTILRKKSRINFEILPKGMHIPLSWLTQRSSNYPPPPPHSPSIILKKTKFNFGMYPRTPIPPSGSSGRIPI